MGIRLTNKQFKLLIIEFQDQPVESKIFIKVMNILAILCLIFLITGVISVVITAIFTGCFTSDTDNNLDCLSNREIAFLFGKILLIFFIMNFFLSVIILLFKASEKNSGE